MNRFLVPCLLLMLCRAPVVLADAESTSSQPDEDSYDRSIERFVMPLSHWLEDLVRDSDVVYPVPRQQQEAAAAEVSPLRQAIRTALQQQPGTVLSAEHKIADAANSPDTASGHVNEFYLVRILSDDGVVREIRVIVEENRNSQ